MFGESLTVVTKPRMLFQTNQSGRHTKNLWGWVSGDGPGDLLQVERRLNAVYYVELLENYLLPGVTRRYQGDDKIYIVEDNCPIHSSRLVADRYAAHP